MTRKMTIMKIMTIMTKMTIMKQHDAKVPFAGGGVLRNVLLLLTLLTFGTNVSWGQETTETDYSGTYYIRSESSQKNTAGDYYLCPTRGWYLYKATNSYEDDTDNDDDNGMPFLTTYQCKTNSYDDISKAVWTIVKHSNKEGYYIIQKKTGRYLVSNGQISGSSSARRMRVHLEEVADETALNDLGDLALFEIIFHAQDANTTADHLDIIPCSSNGWNGESEKRLVVNFKNFNNLKASGDKQDGPNGTYGKGTGGIIGVYSTEPNEQWALEIPTLTFSLNSNNKIEISELGGLAVYYTTDGSDPDVSNTETTTKYSSPISLDENDQALIKYILTSKDGNSIKSSVITYTFNPDVTWSDEPNFVYDGTAHVPLVDKVKINNVDVDGTEFSIEASNNVNAGTALLTMSDEEDKIYVEKPYTIAQRTTILSWTTKLEYSGSSQVPPVEITNIVGSDDCSVTVDGAQTEVGDNYTAEITGLTGADKENYALPDATQLTKTFSIIPKSIGDGNKPADDITIEIAADGTLSAVQQGEKTLVEETDYTYTTEIVGDDKVFIITGMGNYTGSAKGLYASPEFTDPDGAGSEAYAAAYMASRDYAKPAGITPYIVRQVNPSLGTLVVSPIAEEADNVYIPEGVPVLLLSDTEVSGFTVSPKDESIPEISEGAKNSNLLKVAPEEGVTVEAAQVYMFYKGEFVLTKAGTISEGKFFLYNPNYKTDPRPIEDIEEEPGAAPSYGSLRIVVEESTGISDTTRINEIRQMTNEKWYTLDGRLLSGKPTKKGIYIKNARKVIIK